MNGELTFPDRCVVECMGHHEPLQGAVNPEEVLAVFLAWQCNPLGEGHRGVDIGPQKPVLCISILFECGEESKLGTTWPTPK